MTISEPRTIGFQGVRVEFDSEKSYDEVVAALLADIATNYLRISDFPREAFTSWEAYSAEVRAHVGPSDFMLMELIDHGGWIQLTGIHRKALRVILGNPLIAITMLRHDVTAGLFAPVELLVIEEPDNRARVIYVQPSSLMVVDDNPPLLEAAQKLDEKLAALVSKVTS